MAEERAVDELTIFHLVLYEPDGKGGRVKVSDVRLIFKDHEGRLRPLEEARKLVEGLRKRVPPSRTLIVTEEPCGASAEEPHLEATCGKHGLRKNEFFCGVCGEEFHDIKICG